MRHGADKDSRKGVFNVKFTMHYIIIIIIIIVIIIINTEEFQTPRST